MRASVFCVGDLWGWRLMLRGALVVMKPAEIVFRVKAGGFTLRLDEDDTIFWYAEPGKMALPDPAVLPPEARESAVISVALPLRALRKEISAYRNQGHQYPAIIGCQWGDDHKLVRHVLPRVEGQESREDIDISDMLQRYFEYVVNVWLRFAPGDFKEKFPRDFSFPVTVPITFVGELPAGLAS